MEKIINNNELIEQIMAKPAPDAQGTVKKDAAIPSALPVSDPVTAQYLKKAKDIANYFKVSPKTWYTWRGNADFNVPLTSEGYSIEGLESYRLIQKSKDNRKKSIVITEGRQRKLAVETRILEIKEKKELGQLIPFDEHLNEMIELLGMVIQNYSYFITEIELLKNEQLLKAAENMKDKAIMQLREVITNAGRIKPVVVSSSSSSIDSESSSSESSQSSRSS